MSQVDNRDLVKFEEVFVPIGDHGSETTLSSVVTVAPQSGSSVLLVQAVDQVVRYKLDGTDPSATSGFRLNPAAEPTPIPIQSSIKFIEETAGAKLEYQRGL